MTAITHNCAQGSDEWRALRAKYLTASEASAALGASKYQKRNDLIKAKATGIVADVSEGTQFLFNKGHQAEAAARQIVEAQLGEELFPVTMSREVDGLPLLASLDGITMMGDVIWETKLLNESLKDDIQQGQLHNHYAYQIEQQLLVSGAEKCYFTTSDGTPEGTFGMWYVSCPELRAELLSGWKQFQSDVAAYVPEEAKKEAPAGKSPDALPALRIEVTGMVTASNLEQFKTAALSVFRGINTTLTTDQEFADAEKAVKFCKDAEEKLEAAKNHALSQTESIDALFKTIDAIKEEARAVRLKLDKLVKSEKENRKADIVATAKRAFAEHYAGLADRIGFAFGMAHVDFASAIAGLKSLDSMRDKVSVALANAKIDANAIADRIQANQATVGDMSLMPDFQQVCTKLPEDFAALLAMRVAQRKEAEEKRLESERQRIRAEEEAKARAKAAAEQAEANRIAFEAQAKAQCEADAKAAAERAERDRIAAEEIRKLDAERKAIAEAQQRMLDEAEDKAIVAEPNNQPQATTTGTSETPLAGNQEAAPQAFSGKTMNLGQINAELGFTVSADFLASLGMLPVRQEKAAKLYDARKLPTICRLIQEHLAEVMVRSFRESA